MKVKEVEIAKEVIGVMAGDVSPVVPYFNISRQKVPCFNVLQQNRVVFNCFATKHAKDVRSGQPLFCNQPPRGPESKPEIARVSQRESQSEPERARVSQRGP